eukprot:COSAG01_NODE_7491_length_3186_cov_3.612569_5_plen_186_part_01
MEKFEKKFDKAYGLNEIALVPTNVTVDPQLVDISTKLGNINLKLPIIASAMDSVVDVDAAAELSSHGALGIFNAEGVQTRYEDPKSILKRIASVSKTEYVTEMQEIYKEKVKDELISKRIKDIKAKNGTAVVSVTPQNAEHIGAIAADAGADAILVQATVVGANFETLEGNSKLDLKAFCNNMAIP